MATQPLTIASINLLKNQPSAHPLSDLTKVVRKWRPALIGGQEADGYRDIFGHVPGMRVAQPGGVPGSHLANPIWYDPARLRLLGAHWFAIHKGKAGAYPDRGINTAAFMWEVDGTVIFYNNTHVNSHIEKGGAPRPEMAERVHLSAQHFRTLAKRMKGDARGLHLAFCGGDFNVDEDADNRVDWAGFPNAIFAEHGIESVYDALRTPESFDTSGGRKIDVVAFYRGDRRVRAVDVERLDTRNLHTDHSAVCAEFDVTVRTTK